MIEYAQVNDWCQDDLQLPKARDICNGSLALKKKSKILRLSDHKNGDF